MPRTFFFKPPPQQALEDRAVIPFSETITRTLATRGPTDPIPTIFQSVALDTKGYFLINGFVGITVLRDSRPATEPVRFFGDLALDNGGGFQVAATEQLNNAQGGAYTGPGAYGLPVLGNFIGISRQARFALRAASTPNFPARTVTLRLDGVLVGGYGT